MACGDILIDCQLKSISVVFDSKLFLDSFKNFLYFWPLFHIHINHNKSHMSTK